MAARPKPRWATKMPTPRAMASVAWSLTKEKSVRAGARTSSPRWSTKGRSRATKSRIGMLTSSATPAASGAHSSPATAATESSAAPRRRTLHQHQSRRRTSPTTIPYSPAYRMPRSNQPGADPARPLMSWSRLTSGFDPSIASPAICRGPLPCLASSPTTARLRACRSHQPRGACGQCCAINATASVQGTASYPRRFQSSPDDLQDVIEE